MIRDNSPGRASVEHAPSFSGAGTRLQWRLRGCGVVGGDGVLEPWASSDFLGKSWENLAPVAKSWESSAGNSRILASPDGIVHGCTNHDLRRGGVSAM
jgi:hypothetical protein